MSTEVIHIYGEQKNLQGIASLATEREYKNVAILLLNAGMVHKVGPFNMNVDLARQLSSSGYFVFRFDLSGLGDSTKLNATKSNIQTAMDDLETTMAYISTQYDIRKFIIVGLCTGADLAHRISVQNENVIGNVWLDGYGFPTPLYILKRYLPVLLNPARLARSIIYRSRELFVTRKPSGVEAYVWKLPKKADYIREMEQINQRNFKSLYLFSGGVRIYYNYKNQFRDGFHQFKFWNNVEVEHYPDFDHTYLLVDDRKTMINRIEKWLDDNFKKSS